MNKALQEWELVGTELQIRPKDGALSKSGGTSTKKNAVSKDRRPIQDPHHLLWV